MMSFIRELVITSVELVLAVIVLGVRALRVLVDIGKNTRHAFHAEIRCPGPEAHAVPSTGRWRCSGCSYVYEGSVWLCPFCRATTPHVACPTCGLSVASPFRAGKKA